MLEKYVKENGISAVLVRLIVDKLIPPEVTKIEKGYLGWKGHLSIEEVNDNIDKYVECQGAAHGDHSMYVNLTRFLFSFSFALCIVCFIVGIAAYANRERRVWYRTLGMLQYFFNNPMFYMNLIHTQF